MSQIQNKRLMRKAGLEISEYGLGAWAIGGAHYGPVAEEKAKEVISNYLKYSLQGTTQGRYLTGGVPPVRFSM